ncbi:hypothetical protein G3N56_07665 [Desulfovibrio sulfodismutans]|uniref:Uncharacterized protein n=1 Tax=Desulfolutivibrio sulfodismutans TaxID=63561 RepID=A0A7K3NN44_9BACT|nr:hypothetical protein [Desulfolutivibrio sulfodismutans]NDY56619.1 hypothetical protein [Desulfolutivibrio sulfodismutans]QLA11280.1 hypothetical protein GD606_02790 [Desulfolutivibrio sulfodismutans DSM 3696]
MDKRRKKGFTLEQHQRFGDAIHAARTTLVKLTVEASKAYPFKEKVHRRIGRALDAIEELRSELDSLVFAENRDRGSTENAEIYYGPRKEDGSDEKTHLSSPQ